MKKDEIGDGPEKNKSEISVRMKKKNFFLQKQIDETYAKNNVKSIGRHNS